MAHPPDTWDSDTWDSLNRVLDEAAKHRPLAIAALGCCLCRLDIWWAFMLARDASWVSELPVSMHQSIDIGELAAYIALVFVSTRTSTLHAHGMLLVSPVVIAFASLIGLSVSPHASAFRLLAPCSFFGLGFSSIVCLMLGASSWAR